uniref:ATP synthase subunit delta n=1 Tax=Candidatus Kentrum eta TaxID=2126337 RepID=A0A450VBZ2_9GAMM|nr:MAG: F-type H+-transporting ATPase subunit delta [Candidatus Kentron sp. H]VFJ98126.1 MAG: F-type H+-transporting ATPase subunit delta [Candidatus Kentron sp. H]VFK02309.1 MAG: F-type H+-transporting ATPase subunit delta [Candidatus Kentron sp. H]
MAEKNTLARPYAIAAFKQAQEEGKLDKWLDMLRTLAAVAANPDVAKIIKDSRVSKSNLTALLLDISKESLSKTGENFVHVLVYADRMGIVREILQLFEKEVDKFKKRSRVEVTSAYPLTPAYQQDIKTAMIKRLGREAEISVTVDKSLIGGAVIQAGDVVIDMSLRGRLAQLSLDLD